MEDEIGDFLVVTDSPFAKKYSDAKLYFDVTWKNNSSKMIINCRDISSKERSDKCVTKIISLTINEFKAIHNELSVVEPKIAPYFPQEFSYQTIMIERPKITSSWNIFSFQSTTIEEEKEFSDDCIKNIQDYLQAVVEICGRQLLFNIIFKEENITYFEDKDEFIVKKSEENIEKCKNLCSRLLGSHSNYVNLQSLTEEIYKEEDLALENYKKIVYEGFLLAHTKLNENIEVLIEKLKGLITNRCSPDIGPRIIDELLYEISILLREYYEKQRKSIKLKSRLSKSLQEMYCSYLTEILKDKSLYEAVIYRDCAGTRMKNISLSYFSENENWSYFKLLLHSADNIIVDRKIELLHNWSEGLDVIKPNVRHEDYSLIQLRHLNNAEIDLERLDKYYQYIKIAYSLLIEYYEARRVNILNQKQILDDPIDVHPIVKPSVKNSIQLKPSFDDNKDMYQSINIYEIIETEKDNSDEDFQDALDEEKLKSLMLYENAICNKKNELQNEIKRIANIKAELRNSKNQLDKQYKRLKNKISDRLEDTDESIILSSLHPERKKSIKKLKPVPGSSLSSEQREEVARKASERIRLYKNKLKGIPEEKSKSKSSKKKEMKVNKTEQPVPTLILSPPAALLLPPPPPPIPVLPPPVPKLLQFKKGLISLNSNSEKPMDYMKELNLLLKKRRSGFVNEKETSPGVDKKKEVIVQCHNLTQVLIQKLETMPTFTSYQSSEDEFGE